jgi:hypothetical protein
VRANFLVFRRPMLREVFNRLDVGSMNKYEVHLNKKTTNSHTLAASGLISRSFRYYGNNLQDLSFRLLIHSKMFQ